ncbi:class II fructose-bisphosphate aldolase [Candidatus Saccharibacteria bacterium]|nr:class II fructose-bisphosphate aldolase [Candidatus Saccharibacteria bacterium]
MKSNYEAARALYARTRTEKFALGAFNIDNQETLIAVCKAAAAKQAPVLVQASQGEVDAIGLHNIRCLVDNYRLEYGLEMYINLDHSPSVEAAKAGIDAGFEFIHIDFSQAKKDASDEEIVAATKEIVEYAKTTGALVESEPHYFGGGSNVFTEAFDYEEIKKWFTVPAEAKAFIEATGIDTYAVAIGNLHGTYPVPKILDLDLLTQIVAACPPEAHFSLHGGSGTPDDQFRGAVERGISKVNINSDLRKAFRTTLEKVLADNPKEFAIVKLMPSVIEAVQAVVESKIDSFGSAGKAAGAKAASTAKPIDEDAFN